MRYTIEPAGDCPDCGIGNLKCGVCDASVDLNIDGYPDCAECGIYCQSGHCGVCGVVYNTDDYSGPPSSERPSGNTRRIT